MEGELREPKMVPTGMTRNCCQMLAKIVAMAGAYRMRWKAADMILIKEQRVDRAQKLGIP